MTHFSVRQNQNSNNKINKCANLTKMPNDAFLCTFYTKNIQIKFGKFRPVWLGLQLPKVPRKKSKLVKLMYNDTIQT